MTFCKRIEINLVNRNFALFFIGALTLLAISTTTAVGQQSSDWAKRMFKEFSHDFGTVVRGEEAVHRFEIENVYQEDMRIQSVTSSCGCADVSISKNVLKTWEKGEVVVRFVTKNFAGHRKARITVVFAQPFPATVYLDISGNIRTDTVIEPGSVNFGTLVDPTHSSRTIQISRYGNPAWRIMDVKSTYPHVSVALKETARTSNYVSYQLTASLKETAPKGYLQNELIVIASDRPGDARNQISVPVPLMANITQPLHISPAVLPIVGESASEKVIIKADEAFRILDVTCSDHSFRAKAKKEPAKVHIVQIEYAALEDSPTGEVELTFVTDNPNQPQVKLKAIIQRTK